METYQAMLTRWQGVDRLLGLLAGLLLDGGLTCLLVFIGMIVHLRNDPNDVSTVVSMRATLAAVCPPPLLCFALCGVSWRRYRAFSEGLLAGLIVVSVGLLALH